MQQHGKRAVTTACMGVFLFAMAYTPPLHDDSNYVTYWKTFITHPEDFLTQPFKTVNLSTSQSLAIASYLSPNVLEGCNLVRSGPPYDGGYALCQNLLMTNMDAIYNFGISGGDEIGCSLSTQYKVPIHQYDCFNTHTPECNKHTLGLALFHGICVGPEKYVDSERRPFDTLSTLISANKDTQTDIILMMDVEGSEYDVLLNAPDHLFQKVSQLSVELHHMNLDPDRTLRLLKRLSKFFYVAHVHCNNCCCTEHSAKIACTYLEALFVNKRLVRNEGKRLPLPVPFVDFPGNPFFADCPWRPFG